MHKLTGNRMAWGLCALLTGVALGGSGWLSGWVRPYWVAKYHGACADLHTAFLMDAPLYHARLTGANLRGANLRGADLRSMCLMSACLAGADLTSADLTGAQIAKEVNDPWLDGTADL